MFNANTYRAGDTNLKINACSGGIYKTYKESWFIRLYLPGKKAGTLFKDSDFQHWDSEYRDKVVLQMILTADEDYVIAEIINKEDFDKYFEKERGEDNVISK